MKRHFTIVKEESGKKIVRPKSQVLERKMCDKFGHWWGILLSRCSLFTPTETLPATRVFEPRNQEPFARFLLTVVSPERLSEVVSIGYSVRHHLKVCAPAIRRVLAVSERALRPVDAAAAI